MQRGQTTHAPGDIVISAAARVGAGGAVDASSRGFEVLLVEREDLAKGTSSRSTSLSRGVGTGPGTRKNLGGLEALKEQRTAARQCADCPICRSWSELSVGTPFYASA